MYIIAPMVSFIAFIYFLQMFNYLRNIILFRNICIIFDIFLSFEVTLKSLFFYRVRNIQFNFNMHFILVHGSFNKRNRENK